MAQMGTLAWFALAFLATAVIVGTTVAILKTIRVWRSFRSLRHVVGGALEDILRKAADVESRVAKAGETAARLDAAVAQLRGSTSRAEVLATAFGEVRASTRRSRGIVPRK
jgi:hypothetical protein